MEKITEDPTRDNPVVISKNSREQYRFALSRYQGREYADTRIYFLDDDEEKWKPSRKGVTISPDNWPAFRADLEELEAQLRDRGLLEADEGTEPQEYDGELV